MSSEFSALTSVLDVETWRVLGPLYPDYEISDMGRIRCTKDRKGRKAPFILTTSLRNGRPVVTLRNASMQQESRRVDELVLEAFVGPRPRPDFGAVNLNSDRQDVRPDNLAWVEGQNRPKVQGRKKIRRVKRAAPAKVAKEIRHGHWLGIGTVIVSIQPNRVVELTVADAADHHSIPANDLDDVIKALQAAKTIIEG